MKIHLQSNFGSKRKKIKQFPTETGFSISSLWTEANQEFVR